jgi:hypothetical protein
MKALLLGAAALLALGGAAHAQRISNITGAKLLEVCTSRDPRMAEACTAYIDGVSDAASFYQFLRPMDGAKGPRLPDYICVPGATTGPQLRDAILAWARRHPEAMRESAAQVTMRALNDTYLCPGEQRRQ